MNHNLEIQKILLKVENSLNPEDKVNLLKQAINLADANNDLDWGFDLRIDLLSNEMNTSHRSNSFPAYAWLLNTYDSNPDLFNEEDFLWEYKWMAIAARRSVGISRQQVEDIMDDMRMRMNRNGYTDRAFYNIKMHWHLFIGEIEEARNCLKLQDEASRDGMSHCVVCELDARVEFDLIDGNFDKAIALAHDLITKKQTCGRLPFSTFCNFVLYMGKAGDSRAEEYLIRAEEELAGIENKNPFLEDVAHFFEKVTQLMRYMSIRHKEKALKYFEKYAEWEVDAEDAFSYDFSLAAVSILKNGEQCTLNMSPKLPYYRSDNTYNLKELYDHYYTKAHDLAQRFDARHGNSYFMKRLDEMIA